MNSISWLIYAAEVFGRVSAAFALIAILAVFAAAASVFVGMMFRADAQRDARARYNSVDEKDEAAERVKFWSHVLALWPKRFGFAAAFFYAVAVIAPSSSTIYMIAASEMGEKVVTMPEAKAMLGDLREVIAKQIKKLKDDK